MKKILLCICTTIACNYLLAQTDSTLIAQAKTAVTMGTCDDALTFLSRVSNTGKGSADYLLYEGKARECKGDDEQAISCYEKYLALMPSDERIKKRKAELASDVSKKTRAASDQAAVKMIYNDATKGRASKRKKARSKHNNIYDNYQSIGLGYDISTGGSNAPYKNGAGLTIDNGFPTMNGRLVLNYNISSDLLYSPDMAWYGKAFSMSPSDVNSVPHGFEVAATFGVMPVLINKKKIALTVGPEIGFKLISMPDISSVYGSYSFSNGTLFRPCFGLKTDLFIGNNMMFFSEYLRTVANSITASPPFGDNTVPVNYNLFRIGISVRVSDWWYW
jgi:tetratricopeptide (TPR) repeat protein